MKKSVYITLTLFILFSTSCHYKINNYPSLVNQGIVPVSKSQAYVGANLFLSNEMGKSNYLYHFLKQKGAPDAIEIVRKSFNDDRFYIYYYQAKEVYIADPKQDGNHFEWIIKGPKVPNWRDLKRLRNVMDTSNLDAPFVINGREEFFPSPKQNLNMLPKIKESSIDLNLFQKKVDLSKLPKEPPKRVIVRKSYTPKKRVETKVVAKNIERKNATKQSNLEQKTEDTKQSEKADFLSSLEDLTSFKPLNSDQMAIATSKGYAARDNKGNVLHTIRSYTETLQAISFWYTGSEINAVEIEKFNNLSDATNLKIGQTIIIPFNMLKKVKKMPN